MNASAQDYADLKARICAAIDARRDEIFCIAETILHHPELGYSEFKTAQLVQAKFAELGIPFRAGLANTGVKGRLRGTSAGPTVAVLGEMDALAVPSHPCADPVTGAAHACGHNGQIATLLGVAIGLATTGAMTMLSGDVVLFAVPCEEWPEGDAAHDVRDKAGIVLMGGKCELIRRGEFDDVDMAMMIHANTYETNKCHVPDSMNGFFAKRIRFLGKAAHAAGAPHQGINALNAARLALAAIDAQRETFREQDIIRVHSIITRGGEAVNVIPSTVQVNTSVRARTVSALEETNAKVDRAVWGAAIAMGCKAEIQTTVGYLPVIQDRQLLEVFKPNMVRLVGEGEWTEGGHRAGSTDMGDLSQVMPCIHPSAAGARGPNHSAQYELVDKESAMLIPAKALAMTVVDLCKHEATHARTLLAAYKPRMTKEEYLQFKLGKNSLIVVG